MPFFTIWLTCGIVATGIFWECLPHVQDRDRKELWKLALREGSSMRKLAHGRSAWMWGKFSDRLFPQTQTRTLRLVVSSHSTSTASDVFCAPSLWVLRGFFQPCAQRDFLKGPLPREQHNANYSSSARLWDLHDCGGAKGQTSATAFSHNTRKLGGLPVERQRIKC